MPGTDELKSPKEMDDKMVEKITQRYKTAGSNTANLIKERFTRKREAIAKFTTKIKSGGAVDEADRQMMRDAGISDEEIKQIESQAKN